MYITSHKEIIDLTPELCVRATSPRAALIHTGFCIIVYQFIFRNFMWLCLVVWPAVTKHCIHDSQISPSSSFCLTTPNLRLMLHVVLPLVTVITSCSQYPLWNYFGWFCQLEASVRTALPSIWPFWSLWLPCHHLWYIWTFFLGDHQVSQVYF
jgi:hypothetical protein